MGTISENRQSEICGKQYDQDDAILILTKNNDIEVAKINEVLENSEFNVTKYTFAYKLINLFKKQGGDDYVKKNKVVEDLTKCYSVNNNQVLEKCEIIYLDEDTEPHFNPPNVFFCQFSKKGNQLFPVKHSVLTEKSLNNPIIKLNSFKIKSNMGIENTPTTNNVHNHIEIHYENDVSPPPQRNSVKRDLNKSFGNSPSTGNKSILNNYSIIDDETDDKLKIKLRVSKKRNGQTYENLKSPPKLRKSNRSNSRKSYADYISPEKRSPHKRQHSGSRRESGNESDYRQNIESKRTPRKHSKSENSSPVKREIRTPKRYITEFPSLYKRTPRGTPVRRSLRLTSTETESSPRSVRSRKTNIVHGEEDLGVTRLGTNLDDSLRRNILQVNLDKDKIKVNKNRIGSDDESEDDESDDESDDDDDESDDDESDDGKKSNNNNKINLDDSCETKVMRISLQNLNLSNSCEEDSDDCFIMKSEYDSKTKSTSRKSTYTNKTQKHLDTTPKTQKSTKTKISSKSSKAENPRKSKNRAKLIREGVVTPSMHERSTKIKGDSTPLMKARSKLHVSYVPESLPCREKEYCDVYNFVESKLFDGCGGCMYVSGVPGTGKTATVTSVIRRLQENRSIPKFTFVNVNGMRLSEPRQSYVEILKQLKGITLSWEQAQNTLEDMFVKQKKMTPTVMLIDELDILCTKRQDVVYNLLDWPTKAKNQLIVITIANTMDLPERLLMNRVTSRLGLTRLTFQAYTYKHLQEIVTKRLCGTNSFNYDAVQFVARKVASVSGDARRALDICRRAAEIAEANGKEQLVNMNHVNEALSAMITQPKVLAIKSCSRLEQLVLQSTVAEVERTGVEETTFCDIYKMLITCGGIEGFKMVSPTLAQSAVARLSSCRLILADQKCNNIYQKIILNVSVDDVYYALKKN